MSQAARIALDGEITIYRAAELRQTLLGALQGQAGGLDIDLAAVTEIDSAGVQLLMATKRAAQAAGHALTLSNHSEAVVDVLELLNLAAFFGDPLIVSTPTLSEGQAR